MKKIISIITALVMTALMTVSAYASFVSNRVIDKTDEVDLRQANQMNEDMKAYYEETGVDTAIVVLDKLTQGTFQKEAEYYHNQYFRFDTGFVLIYDVNSDKIVVTAFGKYAQRIGEKAGLLELGELLTALKIFSSSYTKGTEVFLDYVQQMIDAYGEDDFTQGIHNTADAISIIVDIGKWFIGPIIGALIVMSIHKSFVRRKYRNLEAASMSEYVNKTQTIFYYANDVFVSEYIHSDD